MSKKLTGTLNEEIENFMCYCQMKQLRPKTMESYETTLKLFFKFLEDKYDVTNPTQVTQNMCSNYFLTTRKRGKYTYVIDESMKKVNNPEGRKDFGGEISICTINNYMRNIRVFFNWLFDEKKIKNNPMKNTKLMHDERIPKDQLTDDEFNRLIKSMDLTSFPEYRDYIIVQLLMDTGMRLGECLMLKMKDLHLEHNAILIPAKITKGKKDRYVFYSNSMSTKLKRWISYKDRYVETEYLFCVRYRGNTLQLGNFEKNFKKYVTRAKITKKVTPHSLRNNFGRRYLLAGGSIFDLSKILGHSSVTITEQAYADIKVEDIRKNYQQFSPLENMNKGRFD